MSQKYKLIQDSEDDSVKGSIKRHIKLASLLIIAPIIALIVLTIISVSSEIRYRKVIANEQRIAVMTRAARPTRTPPTVSRDTPLRTAPGLRFDAIGEIEAGEFITIVARDKTGKWYMLDNSFWIIGTFVIGAPSNLPILP